MLKGILTKVKSGTTELNYGRDVIVSWVGAHAKKVSNSPIRILDIGAGSGSDLRNIGQELALNDIKFDLYGLDSYPESTATLKSNGIAVSDCNIENQPFPYESGFFDIVIANQVIEHTKEIFWIYSEISRILKPAGVILTGVPNIASFHNRIGLLFGMQPTNIELLGPHVRGFTAGSFIKFVETDGYFKNIGVRGANFYPFPKFLAKLLSRIFPRAAVSIFLLTERTEKPGAFREVLRTRYYETPFFTGPSDATL